MHSSSRLPIVLALATGLSGCAGYADITEAARDAYYAGAYEQSIQTWTKLLAGGGRSKDRPLMLIERGIVHLAAGNLSAAAQDFHAGDDAMEVMDFTSDPREVGRYLFSEDSGLYRGPPHEKILIPTLLAIALGAMGKTDRARTAANLAYSQIERFANLGDGARYPSPLALILLGTFAEQNGDTQRAYTAYRRAYDLRSTELLQRDLLRVLGKNASRFGGHWKDELEQRRRQWREPPSQPAGSGDVVVVVLNGKAPVRVETRWGLDSGQRAWLVNQAVGDLLMANPRADVAQARLALAGMDALPMSEFRPRPSRYRTGDLWLPDGSSCPLEEVLPVERQVMAWFESNKSAIYTAAMTRLAFRMSVRVASYLAVKKQSDDSPFAMLVAVASGAALQAADTPDTRCWTLLPRQIFYQRRSIPAGRQTIEVQMQPGGPRLARTVDVVAGGVAVAVFVVPE